MSGGHGLPTLQNSSQKSDLYALTRIVETKNRPTARIGDQNTMRSSKSRSRSKGNRNRSVGNIVNRVFDSSGPEGKVRGTPQQIIEKYTQLTRDAQLSNDRVAAENFAQHAEHYTRMLGEAQREADARREQQEQQQGRSGQNPQGQNQNQQGNGQSRDNGGNGHDGSDGSGEQPDILDLGGESADSGLVETPESSGARARRDEDRAPEGEARTKPKRSRKPKPKSDDAAETDAEARPAPKPRRARKPRDEGGEAPGDGGSDSHGGSGDSGSDGSSSAAAE
ncbi:uncharacterized protein DUF4167 [Brevirhabdus pacifica]|nr:uncharacterized protein DUF4167 [Brevirhabdus pacifica]